MSKSCCVVIIQSILYHVVYSYNLFAMSVLHIYARVPSSILIVCLHQFIASSVTPAPTAQVSNVKVERVNNNRAALVSWTPLTLHQARGFPVYFVTYQPSSQVGRVPRAVSTVNATNSSVVIGDLDPTTEYTFTVDVSTAGGEVRSTLGPGEWMLLECKNCYKMIADMLLAMVANAYCALHNFLLQMLK